MSQDDDGWFSITIDDEEKHPRVILTAGGFPDEEVAMWFVEELEDFMQYLVPISFKLLFYCFGGPLSSPPFPPPG